MRKLFIIGIVLFASSLAYGQTDCSQTPENCVLITREAAIKALEDSDKVKALEAQVTVLKDAVSAHKDIETTLKVELAKAIGENTALQKSEVRLTAWLDIAMKNSRKKCMPFSLCL